MALHKVELWNNSALVNMHSVRKCAERAHKETVFTKILPLASHNGAVFYDGLLCASLFSS